MASKSIKITPDVEEKVINTFFETKYSFCKIADIFGISQTSVGNILKKNGISSKDRENISVKYKFTQEEIDNIVQMYKDGKKLADIQRKYGISNHQTVRDILEKHTNYKRRLYRTPKPKQKFVRGEQPEQLCWHCKNATGGCSWSKSFTPVAGWDAEFIERAFSMETYQIKDCPLFEEG